MSVEVKISEPDAGQGPGSDPGKQTANDTSSKGSEGAWGIESHRKYAVVWICTVAGLIFSLVYSHYGAEFTGISHVQFYGFICAMVASFLLLFAGIVGCLLYCWSDTTFYLSLKLIGLLIPELGLCIAGIVFLVFLPLPNHDEFSKFVLTGEIGNFNRALSRLEEELHCCGVDSYMDYDYNSTGRFPLPLSCCDITVKGVDETNCVLVATRNGTEPPDFPWGCFSNITRIEDLEEKAPNFYQLMQILRYLSIVLLLFSVVYFIIVLLYFISKYCEYLEEKRELNMEEELVGVKTGEEILQIPETEAEPETRLPSPPSSETSASSYSESTVSAVPAPVPVPAPTQVAAPRKVDTSPHNLAAAMSEAVELVAETEAAAAGKISTATETPGGGVRRVQWDRGPGCTSNDSSKPKPK